MNQINLNLAVPQYVRLDLGMFDYSVSVTLGIPEKIVDILTVCISRVATPETCAMEVFRSKNRNYVRFTRVYDYSTPFSKSLSKDSYVLLAGLKSIVRYAKIKALEQEVRELDQIVETADF